jgi:hypothetical protein
MDGVYNNSFAQTFSELIQKFDVSCYKIYQYTHLDQGYLSRLRNGGKENPSPETLVRISVAFAHYNSKFRQSDVQKLFRSVGRSILKSDI